MAGYLGRELAISITTKTLIAHPRAPCYTLNVVGGGLGEASRDFRELFELAGEALPVAGFARDGTGWWFSSAAERVIGFRPGELTAHPERFRSAVHAEDNARIDTALATVEDGGSYRVNYRLVRSDGSIAWMIEHGRCQPSGELYGIVLDASEQHRELVLRRRLLDDVLTAREHERRRLGRELHDELGQTLTSLAVQLAAIEEMARRGRDVIEAITELRGATEKATRDLSDLAHRLRPPAIEELGFVAALHELVADVSRAQKLAIDVHVRGLEDGILAEEMEAALYRMVQEALTNVVKHARAEHVSVLLDRRGGRVTLVVEDDGCGFDIGVDTGRGLGLAGIRERAAMLGGDAAVESRPGAGTTVRVTVPNA